jgi:hypothetical protein
MTSTTSPQAQTDQPPDQQATIAAVTLVLLSGLPFAAVAGYLSALLAPLGIPDTDVRTVLTLVQPRLHPPLLSSQGPAEGFVNRTSYAHTAAYLVNAAERLSRGGSIEAERRFLSQHLAARAGRQSAAQTVDRVSAVWGPLLGWRARMDASTTAACRAANSHNFYAARPPAIGYPGSLHGGTCRCVPGPPFKDAGLVDDAVRSLPEGTV